MSFQISCPHCGKRAATEFRYGGEIHPRPAPGTVTDEVGWGKYLYDRINAIGPQEEWWFHRLGCRKWFTAKRDNSKNIYIGPGGADKPKAKKVASESAED